MIADLKASRELAWRLFVRDVSAQYRQSLFGILWAFAPPIVTSAVFILLQSRNVVSFGSKNIPYPLFVLVGTILWQLFTDSLNAPLKSVTAAKPLLVRVNFPREALIVSAFYMVVFGLMIKLIVLAAVFFIFKVPLSGGLLLAPLAMLMLILLGLCLGLLITPLGMLYTDISTSLPIVIQLFFFVTPVVYETPSTFPFSLIGIFNPVSPLLVTARDLITLGSASNLIPFLVVSGLSIVFLLIAWVVYRVALPIIIERMSA
ncbi:MAG TPA: ABC transporter permease [Anaerolineales bacterium]|nr:ABC transporter permease [Anaerolineales bacterium]